MQNSYSFGFWKYFIKNQLNLIKKKMILTMVISISGFVRLSVRVFTFEVPFKPLFSPTSWSQMFNVFRDLESLGKVMKEVVSDLNIFVLKWLKLPNKKNISFLADFPSQNMVETKLPDGLKTSGWRAYRKFWHISRCFWVFLFWMIFSVWKKWVLGYSLSTRKPRVPLD